MEVTKTTMNYSGSPEDIAKLETMLKLESDGKIVLRNTVAENNNSIMENKVVENEIVEKPVAKNEIAENEIAKKPVAKNTVANNPVVKNEIAKKKVKRTSTPQSFVDKIEVLRPDFDVRPYLYISLERKKMSALIGRGVDNVLPRKRETWLN